MIILKVLKWSNAFSYGDGNMIDFTSNQLVQLVGKNGSGKTSIGLILEEVLFNKNSKGIKKADILNRYSKAKKYNISLTFEKDRKEYEVLVTRGTIQSVKLLCDGIDISSHTATATFADIENLIGHDQKSFSQIINQSGANSLEFLTATDTARKKFLIELWNLGVYNRALDVFKEASKTYSQQMEVLNASKLTIEKWLAKITDADLLTKDLLEEPVKDPRLDQSLAKLEADLKDLDRINKERNDNRQYKQQLDSLIIDETVDISISDLTLTTASTMLANIQAEKRVLEAASVKLAKEINSTVRPDKCPTCGQTVDNSHHHDIRATKRAELELIFEQIKVLSDKEKRASVEVRGIQQLISARNTKIAVMEAVEKYTALYKPYIPTDTLDSDTLKSEIADIKQAVAKFTEHSSKVKVHNAAVVAHNARVDVLKKQRDEHLVEFAEINLQITELADKISTLQVLVKTFSTTGLVAYKIENLVKDLEQLTNEYLTELSDGRFQLTFSITASDKLSVVIIDNGNNIDITALSSGERARVNTATLLAIRKLMQSISGSRINLLILDETIETLDVEGKDKLIEILTNEPNLNTILVSHGYTHPLLEKIHVVKHKNISRLE